MNIRAKVDGLKQRVKNYQDIIDAKILMNGNYIIETEYGSTIGIDENKKTTIDIAKDFPMQFTEIDANDIVDNAKVYAVIDRTYVQIKLQMIFYKDWYKKKLQETLDIIKLFEEFYLQKTI